MAEAGEFSPGHGDRRRSDITMIIGVAMRADRCAPAGGSADNRGLMRRCRRVAFGRNCELSMPVSASTAHSSPDPSRRATQHHFKSSNKREVRAAGPVDALPRLPSSLISS